MVTVRLQKFLASRGVCSRRRAEILIQSGWVQVNGQTVTQLGTGVDPDFDEVRVQGQLLPRVPLRYVLLHKPLGVLSTCSDPWGRPTVLDLIDDATGLHPVGRLDQDTAGALILTNDGDLTQRLTHPSHPCWKIYRVWVRGYPPPPVLHQWRTGVMLDGTPTLPAQVEHLGCQQGFTLLEVHLREGRNRQIRRITEMLGYPVESLTRIAIGPVQLAKLPLGSFRSLTSEEVQSFVPPAALAHEQ